ncbi:MAG: hypothetical protein O2843_12350, partial [Chloroflexi bacterium]|nr:hypothetical protein [Chloroflexota bacterium]
MTRLTTKWRAAAIALAVAGAVSVPAAALARSGPSIGSDAQSAAAPAAPAAGSTLGTLGALGAVPDADGHRGLRVDLDVLATALGVTPEALSAALESVKATVPRPERGADRTAYQADVVAALAQALGLDATTVQTAVDANGLSFRGRGHGDSGAKLDTLATTLGVTTDALQAALESAKSAVDRPAPGGDLAAYRRAIAGSVASTLGLDTATVEAALGVG